MLYSLHFFYLGKFLYVLKLPVIATQLFERNCFAIATKGFKRFEYGTTVYFNIKLSVIMATIPLALPLKAKWFQIHREHCFLLNKQEPQIYPHWRLLNGWITSSLQDME